MSRGLALLACALAAAGCAAPPPQGVYTAPAVREITPAPQAGERPPFLLSINDELEVRFAGRTEMTQVVRVRPDGKISLPFIGAMPAEAKTPEDLQASIVKAYREIGAAAAKEKGGRYLISENDELEVRFPYQSAFNQTMRVRPDGFISLSLVNLVRAEGRTPEDLEAELRKLYAKHLRNPELSVSVRSFTGNRVLADGRVYRGGVDDLQPLVLVRSSAPPQVFVGGEVGRPGVFGHRPNLTLLQAIVEAGGNRPTGEMRNVMILRKSSTGQPVTIRRNLSADLRTERETNDVFLQPSDVVVVPKTGIAEVAEALDQYVFQIVPFIRNSSFAFIYNLRDNDGTSAISIR